MGKKTRTKISPRGYEVIVYPSDLNVLIKREYEDHITPDRRRKNCDVKTCTSIDIQHPWEDYNIDIPDDTIYFEIIGKVQDICCKIISSLDKEYPFTFHYAFNLHDQDRGADGHFLKNHFHVYIWSDDKIESEGFPDCIERLKYKCADFFNHIKVRNDTVYWSYDTMQGFDLQTKVLDLSFCRINPIKNVDCALRYLLHVDNTDKVLYKLEDCVSDIDLYHHRAFLEATQASHLNFLIDCIDRGYAKSYAELYHIASANGCVNTYIKCSFIIMNYIKSITGQDDLKDHYRIPQSASPEEATNIVQAFLDEHPNNFENNFVKMYNHLG